MRLKQGLSLVVATAWEPWAQASVGLDVLPGQGDEGPVTVFYPSQAASAPLKRGSFTLDLAWQAAPVAGNHRLVVLSHGSGGSPWPQADLASALAQAGYVVALPEHRGDNWHDHRRVGPQLEDPAPGSVGGH
jgi:predicted dienelactone hydrolase